MPTPWIVKLVVISMSPQLLSSVPEQGSPILAAPDGKLMTTGPLPLDIQPPKSVPVLAVCMASLREQVPSAGSSYSLVKVVTSMVIVDVDIGRAEISPKHNTMMQLAWMMRLMMFIDPLCFYDCKNFNNWIINENAPV
jgi:hypothetical protein